MSRPMQKLVWISFVALTLIAQAIAQGGATGAISGVERLLANVKFSRGNLSEAENAFTIDSF